MNRSLTFAHAVLRLLGVEPIRPPLYYKTWSGNVVRIWTPTAEKAARLRAEVYLRDEFTCQECGTAFDHPDPYDGVRKIEGLTLGHLIDYRFGGPYELPNLQAECTGCNLAKAHMTPPGTPARVDGRFNGAYGEKDSQVRDRIKADRS